jgi:hypothetical protein
VSPAPSFVVQGVTWTLVQWCIKFNELESGGRCQISSP